MRQETIDGISQDEAFGLCGPRDEHLRLLREHLQLQIVAREDTISLSGPDEQVATGLNVLGKMRKHWRTRKELTLEDVRQFLAEIAGPPASAPNLSVVGGTSDGVGTEGKELAVPSADAPQQGPMVELVGPLRRLRTQSPGQVRYVEAMRQFDLTFCLGPAGTGKTYLAVAAALEGLRVGSIKRIVLVRPAVEAGEKLGFLPGDLTAKVHPYLRPLLDALRDMLDYELVQQHLANDIIEIAPLAFMRGRTLNEAFIILDEAQNTTVPQMKMFLTRMGMGSRIVVTGDPTQVDLPGNVTSGMSDAVRRLGQLPRVGLVHLDKRDIVRHPLVQMIVEAYDQPAPNQ